MTSVTLVADGGEMTVSRRSASHVWGAWNVTLPEGVEQTGKDERVTEGYSAKLNGAHDGLFDRAFVRADADINIPEGVSSLEDGLAAAAKRVDGNLFFERDISDAGLARYIPNKDFRVGDIVRVRLWGILLPLLVTAIELTTGSDRRIGWRVHVGGQLLRDAAALSARSSAVQRKINEEKRARGIAIAKESQARIESIRLESEAREAAVLAEANARTAALSEEARLRDAAILAEAKLREDGDLAEEAARVAAINSALTSEQQARVRAIEAEVSARNSAISAAVDRESRDRAAAISNAISSSEQKLSLAISSSATDFQNKLNAENKAWNEKAGQLATDIQTATTASTNANDRISKLTDAISGNSTNLTTESKRVYDAVNTVRTTANKANQWTVDNQVKFNQAVALAQSAQAAYNNVNDIQWLSQSKWNAEQQKINDANNLFKLAQAATNDINRVQWLNQSEWNAQQTKVNQANDLFKSAQLAINDVNDIKWLANSEWQAEKDRVDKAQDEAIALAWLKNHGSWYMSGTHRFREGTTYPWFDTPRGTPVGCLLRELSSGDVVAIFFNAPGEWEINFRIEVAPYQGVVGGGAVTLGLHLRQGNTTIDSAEIRGYDTGWAYGQTLRTVFDVPAAGCYAYPYVRSGSSRTGLWSAGAGRELTELSCRQLSNRAI